MKDIKHLYVLILSSFLTACVGLPELLREDEYCQTTVCNFSATIKPYPLTRFAEPVREVNVGGFKLQVPTNGKLHKETPTRKQIIYQNQTGLLVQQIAEGDFELDIPQAFSKGQFKVIDYPAIMFLNTVQQPEPQNYYDRYIWRLALSNKGNYFKENYFFASKNNRLNLYHAKVNIGPITDMVFVTVTDKPEVLLKLYNYGLKKEIFDKILASIAPVM